MTVAVRAPADLVSTLETLEQRLRWLSGWMIHHANNIRPKRDGLKAALVWRDARFAAPTAGSEPAGS